MNSNCLSTQRSHLNVHSSQRALGSPMLKDAVYREAVSLYSQGSLAALYLWKLSVCLSQSATIWTKPTHTERTPCPQRHFIKSKLDWKNDRLKCIFNRLLSGVLPVKQRGLKSHSDTRISPVFPAAWKQKTIVDAWGKRIFKQRHPQRNMTAWKDRTGAAVHICKETLSASVTSIYPETEKEKTPIECNCSSQLCVSKCWFRAIKGEQVETTDKIGAITKKY